MTRLSDFLALAVMIAAASFGVLTFVGITVCGVLASVGAL